eukprot:superscaffoldBa00000323_g3794
MAGNFWQSSHYLQWVLDKQDLMKERQKDLKFLSEEEYWKLQIFFANVIQALGEHLKLRQQVIATATVYFKRFYARYSLKSIDPVLMAPTCVFLASKVECHITACQDPLTLYHNVATSVSTNTRDSTTIVHTPTIKSLSLWRMVSAMAVIQRERLLPDSVPPLPTAAAVRARYGTGGHAAASGLLHIKFIRCNVISSSAFPPTACLHVACVVQQKDARQWFAELSVDMDKILEIIRVILKLYDQWKNFDDRKEIAAVLNKMPKPKPPPNSESDQSSNGNQSNSYSQS